MTTPVRASIEQRAGPSRPLHRLAIQIAGRNWQTASPEALASLLMPIVRRVIHTGRGPTALRRWIALEDAAVHSAVADRKALALTANLVQLLLHPPEVQRDTVRF